MRLLASDLDGTLIGRTGRLSARTQAMLEACAAAGVAVVFVTGRPPRWLDAVSPVSQRGGVAICANGALTVALADRAVIAASTVPAATVLEIVSRLGALSPDAAFALETLEGIAMEPGFRRRSDDGPARMGEISELLDPDPRVVKVLARAPGVSSDDFLGLARPALDGLAAPTHSNAADGLIEIAALGVSKAGALAEYAAGLGLGPADVVAFGDMPNDVEMLRWAGSSYAMSGAHPEAIAAADDVAPPCEEDGVAQVVERLLGSGGRSAG